MYGLIRKTTYKHENHICNFATLEHEKSLFKRKLTNLQRKRNSISKIMDIDNCKEFSLLKKEFEEFRQQSKSLESENRALEQLLELLKDPVVTTFNMKNKKRIFMNV